MAGMTNPAIKNLESRMSELEREMSDLREKIESKETTINNAPKEENIVPQTVNYGDVWDEDDII